MYERNAKSINMNKAKLGEELPQEYKKTLTRYEKYWKEIKG